MKAQPITRGRKQAVKRVQRIMELEWKRAARAVQRAVYDHGKRSPQAIIAVARLAETENIKNALFQGLDEVMKNLSKTKKPDAATSETAVQPPERPVDTGMSAS